MIPISILILRNINKGPNKLVQLSLLDGGINPLKFRKAYFERPLP